MTNINPDDPKWTAYALGELNGAERDAVEAELNASEEARMLVEDLRFAAQLTKAELRDGTAFPALTATQRETIYGAAAVVRPRRWFARPVVWVPGLAAAGLALLALTLSPVKSGPVGQMAEVAANAPTGTELRAPAAGSVADQRSLEFGTRYPDRTAPAQSERAATSAETGQGAAKARTEDSVALAGAPPADRVVIGPADAEMRPAKDKNENKADDVAVSQNIVTRPSPAIMPQLATPQFLTPQLAPSEPTNPVRQERQNLQGQQGQGQQQSRFFATPPAAPAAPGVPRNAAGRTRDSLYNGTESYGAINDNPFLPAAQNQLSTFSIDADTASYSNIRRFINQNQLPPRDAVRIEEMINYFNYDYPQPPRGAPVGATVEAASAPWNPQHRLVRVAIKARELTPQRRPPSNLVFLLDVSGSMQPAERLPLLKRAIRMLVEQLSANDRVTVVTYAGTTGIALQPTPGNQKDVILGLIDSLEAGGSTNGGSGIQLAYQEAAAGFIPGGVNRVILATDGDFNVGITDRGTLLKLIEEKARSGVFLTVLGVGMGNYKDATLEMLADKGHGNYAYLDTLNEARKVLVEQMSGTLVTVAKDVKVQVEFNPSVVDAYRLIGYENRALRNEDFNNDQKDAGDMGAGHTVTVLYEVVPRGVSINAPGIDPLKYQQPVAPAAGNVSNETLTIKIRYKEPSATQSNELVFPLVDREQTFSRASVDFRFAAAVAAFGMVLRDSPYKGTATMDSVLSMAEDGIGPDKFGYRREFLQLAQRARQIR